MKLGLFGYGKMGKKVEEQALLRGHEISCRINSAGKAGLPTHPPDLFIDFSRPDAVLDNIQTAARLKTNLVIGTTGWQQHIPLAKEITEKEKIGILFAPNFSFGIYLFSKLAAEAAKLFADYQITGIETHHKQKLDAPSGTAKMLSQACGKQVSFTSIREGEVPGIHTLVFDGPIDTITLTHEAKNRDGFARGAVIAAEWLQGKSGFYTLEEMLG